MEFWNTLTRCKNRIDPYLWPWGAYMLLGTLGSASGPSQTVSSTPDECGSPLIVARLTDEFSRHSFTTERFDFMQRFTKRALSSDEMCLRVGRVIVLS